MLAVGLAIHAVVLRAHSPAEGRLLSLSFALHVVSGFTQVLLVLYYFPGGGDMLEYFRSGVAFASLLRADFGQFAPELALTFLQQDARLPFGIAGGATTGSMTAFASFVLFLTGDSLYAAVQLIGLGAYASQVMLFRALRSGVSSDQTQALLVGLLLLPSAVFWSSALLKEPVVFCALGPLILCLQWLASGVRRPMAILLGAPAVLTIAVIKPYVLMALSVAGSVYYLAVRFRSRTVVLRPFALITAVGLAAGGITLGSRFFAKPETESAAASFAAQRQAGYGIEGGSNFTLDGPEAQGLDVSNRTLAQELFLTPIALGTALFRPFLFEARNAVQFANAVEATALLWLSIQVFRRRRWTGLLADLRNSPVLAFCAAFALVLAIGTGLSTSNMGTLSRYRAPMMPFFFALLMVLRKPAIRQATGLTAANIRVMPAAAE